MAGLFYSAVYAVVLGPSVWTAYGVLAGRRQVRHAHLLGGLVWAAGSCFGGWGGVMNLGSARC